MARHTLQSVGKLLFKAIPSSVPRSQGKRSTKCCNVTMRWKPKCTSGSKHDLIISQLESNRLCITRKNAFSRSVKYTKYAKVFLIFLDLLSTCCYVTNTSVSKVRDVFSVTTLPVIKEYIVSALNELHMSTEHGWNDDIGTVKYSEQNMFQCYFVHHKSHMYWPVTERVFPWQESNN
jgi:hypothetical protein